MLIDTHAHIQFGEYVRPERAKEDRKQLKDRPSLKDVLSNAKQADVRKILCVGTDEDDSAEAIELADKHEHIFASVGLHPHEAKKGQPTLSKIGQLVAKPKVVAVGECGLDYYYEHSTKQQQQTAFRYQVELALEHSKPLIFHVRDAFDDFFKIIDDYDNLRGVVHSFSSTPDNLEASLKRGFFVAFNGIMTFTKDQNQLDAAKQCPLNKMLLETDCPFLTPTPYRGKINQPSYVREIAQFLANSRGESFEELAQKTTANATALFGL